MSMENKDIYFSIISTLELDKNIEYLIKNNLLASIWKKGKNEKNKSRETIVIKSYHRDSRKADFVYMESRPNYYQDDVLVNFSIKGVHFFGTGHIAEEMLVFNGDFFKYERRANFRLVIELHSEIVYTVAITNGLSKLKVHDISVGGMALIIEAGEKEKEHFSPGRIIQNIDLSLNKLSFPIARARVAYVIPHHSQFKVGLQFLDLPVRIGDQLGHFINRYIKRDDIRQAFENFLT